VTSEMAMLLSFILFGIVLSGFLPDAPLWPTLGLAALVIFVIRPLSLGLVLLRARMSWEARGFICWFGPRGLNSLLLALLVVQAGLDESELLLAVIGVVVLASTIVHGASATPVTSWYARRIRASVYGEERESDAVGIFEGHDEVVPRKSVEELHGLLAGVDPPIVLDVRSRMNYEHDKGRLPDDVRVLTDQVADWVRGKKPDRAVVAYCT
jgi:NhaP-type Na+/H+ or K+/H+ antiporter